MDVLQTKVYAWSVTHQEMFGNQGYGLGVEALPCLRGPDLDS